MKEYDSKMDKNKTGYAFQKKLLAKEDGGKDAKMQLAVSFDQSKKFTEDHTVFDGKLLIEGNELYFNYQCNLKYNQPTFADVFGSILIDASSYDSNRDIDDFAKEFGYEKVSEAIAAFNGCKEHSEFIHRVFSEKEIDELYEWINNNWERTDFDELDR